MNIECNCEWCKFYENGCCTLDTIQIEAQVLTPMGFVPMCNSMVEVEDVKEVE